MSFSNLLIILIAFCWENVVCITLERPFLYVENEALPVGVDHIIGYLGTTDFKLTDQKIKEVSSATLIPLFKEYQKNNVDTVFACIPSADFNMINELAVQYNIFIWNIIPYTRPICYSNIIFGYDSVSSSLYTLSREMKKFENVGVVYDSNDKDTLGTFINDTMKLFNFNRVPVLEVDKKSAESGSIIGSLYDYIGNTNITSVYLLNFFKTEHIIEAYKDPNATPPPGKTLTLVNMPVVPRELIYKKGDGTYILGENAMLPTSLIGKIDANYNNEHFSIESIILYSMFKLYETIGSKYLNDNFKSGSDIIYFAYNHKEYITIYEDGDDVLKVGLAPGNRLSTYVDFGEIDITNGVIKDNQPVEMPLEVSYTITNGFPREYICNQLVSDSLYKPDALYILLFTYRNFYHEDITIRNLSRYDENVIHAFEAAINYLNAEKPVLNKQIVPIYMDISAEGDMLYKEYVEYRKVYNIITSFSTSSVEDTMKFLSKIDGNNITAYTYISLQPDGRISIYSMWKFVLQEFTNIVTFNTLFVVSSKGIYSQSATESLKNITNEYGGFSTVIYEVMKDGSREQALNVCAAINSRCTDGCLVANLLERDYLQVFFSMYNEIVHNNDKYPVISFTLDEEVMDNSDNGWANYDGSYFVSYYLEELNTTDSKDFKKKIDGLRDVNIKHYSSSMALGYVSMMLLANAVNLARSDDRDTINQMIVYASSIPGPGGNVEWNNQGTINSQLYIGRVCNESESVKKILSSSYIMATNAFTDISIQCNWIDGDTIFKPYYDIVFLYVTDNYIEHYLNYYKLYASIMTDYLNMKNGINNKLLKSMVKIFNSITEMKKYVEESSDNENLLAYFGTTTNEQKDAIADILTEKKKFLFNFHPGEGQRCYSNIIQVGRVPNQYAFASIATIWQYCPEKKAAIVMCDNKYCHDVGEALAITTDTFKEIDYIKLYINSTFSLDNITDVIKEIQTGRMMIFTVLGNEINDMINLMNEKNMDPAVYTIISLDTLAEWIDTEVWDKHLMLTSYTRDSKSNQENEIFVNDFTSKFGNNSDLLNEHTLSLYTSLMILKTVYEQASDYSYEEIRRQLKGLSIDLPVGTTTLRDDMVCSSSYVLIKMDKENSNGYTIILQTIQPMSISTYLAYRNDGDTSSCELVNDASEPLVINLVINTYEESFMLLLDMYLSNYNEMNYNIVLVKYYCDEFNGQNATSVVITSCSVQQQNEFLEENPDLLLISIINKNADICDKRIIDLGTYPSQRVIAFIGHIVSYVSPNIMLIVSTDLPEVDYHMINDTITSLGGFVKGHLVVNESDSSTIEEKLSDFMTSYKLYIPDGGVILNYLTTVDSYTYLFRIYQSVFANVFTSSVEASQKIPIFSFSKETFMELDPYYTEQQFALASCHSDKYTAANIYNIGVNMFGGSYQMPKLETRAIIAYELLLKEYKEFGDFSNEKILNYLSNYDLESSFGITKMSDSDTNIPFPVTILKMKPEGIADVVSTISINWPAQSFRHGFNYDEYKICSKKTGNGEDLTYPSLKFYVLISFTGDYSYNARSLINGYLAAFDFINEYFNGIYERMLVTEVINIESDKEKAREYVRKAINETGNRIIFGLSNSEMRKYVMDDLEENGLLLFYPFLYEGYECSENVIYMNTPFTEYVSTLAYFYLPGSEMREIFILYTDTEMNYRNALNVQYELTKRGINVVNVLRIPLTNYKMDIIMNIIISSMKSGFIISLLEGQAATDLFVEINEKNYDSKTYTVVSFNVNLPDVTDDSLLWQLFDGHYFIDTYRRKHFKDDSIHKIADNRYSFVKEEASASAILSVLFAARALLSINFAEDTGEEGFVPYSFEDILDAVHHADVSQMIDNIVINTNNQISKHLDLVQVHYFPNNNTHELEILVQSSDLNYINPYSSQYGSNNTMYYCEWDISKDGKVKRGELLERENKKVALLYAVTGENRKYELRAVDIIVASIDSLNNENRLNNTYLDYIIFDTTDESNLTNIANIIVDNDDIVFIVGCSNIVCRNTINDVFSSTETHNRYLWYPAKFEGQECDENIFYTGLLPSIYSKSLATYIDQASVDNSIYFIGTDTESNRIINQILHNSLSELFTIIGDELVESGSATTHTIATTIVEKYVTTGCVIILTLDDTTSIDFINYFDSLVSEAFIKSSNAITNRFYVISISSDRNILGSLVLSGNINLFFGGSYFDEINKECPFRTAFVGSYGEDLDANELAHSSYLALMYWSKAVEKVGYKNKTLIRIQLYRSNVDSCTGETMMFDNNHISLPYFIMQVVERDGNNILEPVYSQTRIQEPLAWSWDIEATNGLICDFTDPNVGSGKKVETITIAVGLSVSGKYRETDLYVLNIFELLFDDLNNNGNGLLNKRVTIQSYDLQSSDSVCVELLRAYLTQVEEGVIFTSATSVCIKSISSLLVEKNIPLFEIGYTGGETCYQNVFYMLKEPSFIGRIVDYIMEPTQPSTLHFCVLTINDDVGSKYYNYINSYLEFVGATVDFSANNLDLSESESASSSSESSSDKKETSKILADDVKGMVSATKEYGCYILYYGDSALHYLLDKQLTEATNTTSRDKYNIVSLSTASNAAARGVKSFYSAQSYFTNLDNDENKKMKDDILSVTNYASEIMYAAYISSDIYINTVNKVKSMKADVLRKEYYSLTYSSPSGGDINIGVNNYINQYVIYGKMKEEDPEYGFDVIFSSATVYESVPYKDWVNNAKYICDFKNSYGDMYRKTSKTIGILTSYSGVYNTTERSITQGIIQAIDEINKDGGIIGTMISMLIKDAKSDINLYKTYAEELCRLDEVIVVFGVANSVIATEIYTIFEEKKKLFFFNGLTITEACPRYTISTQLSSNQLINGVWKYILPYTYHVYIIQDDELFSSQLTRGVQILCENINLDVHVYNLSDIESNKNYIPNGFDPKSLDKNSVVLLNVVEQNNLKIFNWLCGLKIDMKNTYIVSVSLDRYLMDYIDGKCLDGAYILTSFIKEMGLSSSDTMTFKSSSESFVSSINDRYGQNSIVTASMESGYTSVKLWANVIISYTMSFDTEKVGSALYGYTTVAPSGTIEMSSDGFTNRIVYLVKISEDKSLKVVDYASQSEKAEAWNHLFPENEGYICDYSSNSENRILEEMDNDRYRPESLKLVFFHDSTESKGIEIDSMLMEYSLVQELNTNGGLNNQRLIPVFIFASTYEEFSNFSNKFVNDKEVISFFGCKTDACKKNAEIVSKDSKRIWISYDLNEGGTCSGNHIISGSTASQRFLSIEYYLHNNEPEIQCLIFIGDDSETVNSYYKTVNYFVKDHYKVNKHALVRVTIDRNSAEKSLNDAITTIQQRRDEYDRVAILYYLTGEISKNFFEKYTSSGLTSREAIVAILNYVSNDYTSELLSSAYGSLVVTGFDSVISTSLAQSFVSTTEGFVGVNKVIDETLESIKTSFMIWQEVYRNAALDSNSVIPPLRYFQLSGVGLEISAPSGKIKIEESLYSSRNSYVFEINRNAKFIQVFPTRGSEHIFEAEPYPSGLPSECKFGKKNVFYSYNKGILSVAYVLFGIAMLMNIACLVFVIIHQKQLIIKVLGRSHNFGVLLSLFIITFGAIPMYIYPSSTNGVCTARVVLLSLGVKSLLGVLLSSETKLYKKRFRIKGSIKKTRITVFRTLSFWLVFMLFQSILLLLWFLIDPNEYIGTYSSSESNYFNEVTIRECTISTPFVVIELVSDFLPALLLFVLTNSTKNLANEHNDTLSLFISCSVLLVLGAIMVLLDFNINTDPDSVLLLRSMGINLSVIIIDLLEYGIKLVSMHYDEDAKNDTLSGSANIVNTTNIGVSVSTTSKTSHPLSSMSFASGNMSRTFTTKNQLNKIATLTKH